MLRGIFVTGTDTNAGKTVACAALLHRYRGGVRLRYWKPVQTGIEQDDDTSEVRRLAAVSDEEIFDDGVRLPRPVSPHLAARLAGRPIAIQKLTARIRPQPDDLRWIVEGAGGALVPLNETELMTDLMRALALPVLVVARSSLGTINHTLLTVEALRRRDLDVAGVLMVGEKNLENRAAIEHYGGIPVLGEMPVLAPLDAARLSAWACAELDSRNRLRELLP
ncbi:MAG TPA: dethiobiotin synthase [Bryobacteraceae bacterium]|nr:dethiobiotin synthase [Bryobacteraceae bacterium]